MPHGDVMFALDRRALLHGAILLVGGVAAAPAVLAAPAAGFFTVPERATVAAFCATMIPRTDTPGAIEAGVPAFLDSLMAGWASPAHKATMRATLAALARSAQADAGRPLSALAPDARTAWLTRQDAALIAAKDAGYLQLKRLVMTGYYYSEAGATQELRYELVPGVWEPAMPITADTRTWAA